MPTATLGLTTYRRSNNFKSLLLLAAFPLLLLALLGGIFFAFGLLAGGQQAPYGTSPFAAFGIQSVLGTGSASDLAVSAMVAYWPIIFGIAAVWMVIGYFFNSAIIHAATGAMYSLMTESIHRQLYRARTER